MRLVIWGLVIIAFGYAAYAGMVSVWSYFSVASALDEAFLKAKQGGRPDVLDMKQQILQTTNEAGVPLTDQDVTVYEAERNMQVYIVWSVPVFVIKGEPVLAIPISIKRTLDLGDAPAPTPGRRVPVRPR